MSHVPFFWKQSNFPGWDTFLVEYLKNKKKAMTLAELSQNLSPSSSAKIYGTISGTISVLVKHGKVQYKIIPERRGRHYFVSEDPEVAPKKEQESALGLFNSHETSTEPDEIIITPRAEYHKKRVDDLINVVFKSFDKRKPISIEWIDEYNDLIK